MDLHHPLFRSLLLPLGLALIGAGLLGPAAGRRWAAAVELSRWLGAGATGSEADYPYYKPDW